MKRTSHNRSRTVGILLVALLCVALCLFGLLLRPTLSSVVWRVVAPILTHNPLSALSAQFVSKASLAAENTALRAALASTTATLADRDFLVLLVF